MSKLLSIIISSHNNEDTIKKCIDSFYDSVKKRPVEVVCIDDHSTDNTLKIVSQYPKIKIRNLTKHGLGASRNEGINYSTGELLWFIDADDTLNHKFMDDHFFKLLSEANEKDDMLLLGINKIYDDRTTTTINKETGTVKADSKEASSLFQDNLLNNSWNKIYKRKYIIKNNLSFTDYSSIEDIMFNCEYFRHVDYIKVVAAPLYNYYVYSKTSTKYTWHPNQREMADILLKELTKTSITSNLISDRSVFENMVDSVIGLQINIFNKFKGKPTYKEYKSEAESIRLKDICKYSQFKWCGFGYTFKYIIMNSDILSYEYILKRFF